MSQKTISFNPRIVKGAKNIIARDSARAEKLKAGLHPHGPAAFQSRTLPDNLISQADTESFGGPNVAQPVPPLRDPVASMHSIDATDSGVAYTINVGVGQPPQYFTLIVDTGSSNTWIGAGQPYHPTSTSQATGEQVTVAYGSASFSGIEYIDTVTLAPDLVIQNQSIGVASVSRGFAKGVDGILGIGPVDLTSGTLVGAPSAPTVADNLFNQGAIQTQAIGISYAPTSQSGVVNGELTFGDVDNSKFTGKIEYVPITGASPANRYWGIDQSITYGDNTVILNQTAGVVDTGSTLILFATDAFQAYQQATGATLDSGTGHLTVTQEQFDKMQSLYFNIGNSTFELTPNAQTWPRALNGLLDGDADAIHLVVGNLGNNSGSGLDFINGFAFSQHFYTVYDTTNSRVGIAATTN